jgi:hypothetical protein
VALPEKSRRHRPRRRGRRDEAAEAVEHAARRHDSCALFAFALRLRRTAVVPASATMRLSISTKAPDSGKSDQRVSPVTWNSTIRPLPRRAAVTSGVPSASVAQVFSLSAHRVRPAPAG